MIGIRSLCRFLLPPELDHSWISWSQLFVIRLGETASAGDRPISDPCSFLQEYLDWYIILIELRRIGQHSQIVKDSEEELVVIIPIFYVSFEELQDSVVGRDFFHFDTQTV